MTPPTHRSPTSTAVAPPVDGCACELAAADGALLDTAVPVGAAVLCEHAPPPGHVATVVVGTSGVASLLPVRDDEPVMVEVKWVQPPDREPGQTVTTMVLLGASEAVLPVRLAMEGLPVIVSDGVVVVAAEEEGAVGPGLLDEDGTGSGEPEEVEARLGRMVPLVGREVVVSEHGTVRMMVEGPPLEPQVSQTVTVVVKPGGIELLVVGTGRVLPV